MIDIRKITNGYWWDALGKYEALIKGENDLRELTMQVTDRCNLNCPKCNHTNFTFEDMKTSDIMRILTEACNLGLRHVHFTGGEPTLHEDFIDIVKFCRDQHLRIDMSSNGMFSREYAEKLVAAGIDSINVSWDFLDKRPQCLSFIDDVKTRWFINHMVMPANFDELPVFLRTVAEMDSIIDVQLMPPRGTAEKFTEAQLEIFFEQTLRECAFVWDEMKYANKLVMVRHKLHQMINYPDADRGIYHIPIEWPCHRSKVELRVGAKGFTTCTYLYRDGHVTCGLENSVSEALRLCVEECKGAPPVPSMCQFSCSPEIANFNYFVEKGCRRTGALFDFELKFSYS